MGTRRAARSRTARDEVREIRERLPGRDSIRRIARRVARRHRGDASLEPVLKVVRLLWRGRSRDERSVAIATMAALTRKFHPDLWDEFKRWVGQAVEPEHAFAIGEGILGPLVCHDRSWCRVLRHWIRSKNPWMRLAAAAAVGFRTARMSDFEAAFYVCGPLLSDPNSRVRKAAEEVMKEARRAAPAATREFLSRRRAGRRFP